MEIPEGPSSQGNNVGILGAKDTEELVETLEGTEERVLMVFQAREAFARGGQIQLESGQNLQYKEPGRRIEKESYRRGVNQNIPHTNNTIIVQYTIILQRCTTEQTLSIVKI